MYLLYMKIGKPLSYNISTSKIILEFDDDADIYMIQKYSYCAGIIRSIHLFTLTNTFHETFLFFNFISSFFISLSPYIIDDIIYITLNYLDMDRDAIILYKKYFKQIKRLKIKIYKAKKNNLKIERYIRINYTDPLFISLFKVLDNECIEEISE